MTFSYDSLKFVEGGQALSINTISGSGGGTANFGFEMDAYGVWWDEPLGSDTTRKFVPWSNVASIQQGQ